MKSSIALLFMGLISTAWAQAPQQAVTVDQVTRSDEAPIIWISGTIATSEFADLSSEQEGVITYLARFAQHVARDEVIARIDDERLLLQKRLLQTRLQEALEQRDYSDRQLQRLRSLTKRNNVSQTQLDEATHQLKLDQLAEQAVRLDLEQLNMELNKSRVIAPFDGIIGQRHAQPNEYVRPGDKLVKLLNDERFEIVVMAPLKLLPHLGKSGEIQVKQNDQYVAARLSSQAPQADQRSRLVELRLSMDNSHNWVIGSPVQVALPTRKRQSVLVLPQDAVVTETNGSGVFRLTGEENRVERVPVELLFSLDTQLAVEGELTPGDTVVVRGAGQLKDGDKVKVIQ